MTTRLSMSVERIGVFCKDGSQNTEHKGSPSLTLKLLAFLRKLLER